MTLLDVNDELGASAAEAAGGTYVHLDVSQPDEWRTLFSSFDRLDLLHLNAGIYDISLTDITQVSDARYRAYTGVNLDGVFFGLREAIPLLEQSHGAVVVTSSMAGLIPLPGNPLYAATKWALIGLVRSVHGELERRGIRINALCPGAVATPLMGEDPHEFFDKIGVAVVRARGPRGHGGRHPRVRPQRRGRAAPPTRGPRGVRVREAARALTRGGGTMDESAVPRLRIRGLDAGYGRVQVLFGLDLDVAPGEAVAVLGTNGAGKTTLLRAVSGLLTPTAGTIALDGDDLGSRERGGARPARRRAGARRRRVRRTHRRREPARRVGRAPGRATRRRRRASPGSTTCSPRWPRTGSRTRRRCRAASSRWWRSGARCCTSRASCWSTSCRSASRRSCVQRLLDVLGALRDDGQAMVVVEQSLAVAARLTDRVVFVEKGAVRFDGAPADLTADEELARAVFLGGPATSPDGSSDRGDG